MRIGSLFSGYGGLDMAVASVLGAQVAWFLDNDKHAGQILAHHYPDVPNYGDVTTVDWATVEPVDILTGGYPCQPFSSAGKRKGADDERHLWPYIVGAIRHLRPQLVVLENVRGHLSLGFADVLGDLAQLGWSAKWGVVRASDAGAPHQRARLFVIAYPDRGRREQRHEGQRVLSLADAGRDGATAHAHGTGSQGPQSAGRPDMPTWGDYGPAIARWEHVTGRQAPDAIEVRAGAHSRLEPAFVEWLMGLPSGWVTGVGLSRTQQLRILGNGVVPQQAALALDVLLKGTPYDLRQGLTTV